MKKFQLALLSGLLIPGIALADTLAPSPPFYANIWADPATFFIAVAMPFILTVVLELIVFWLILRAKMGSLVVAAIVINLITWPIASYIYARFLLPWSLVEVCVFVIEILLVMLLLRVKFGKAILISFLANFVSALMGYLWLWLQTSGTITKIIY